MNTDVDEKNFTRYVAYTDDGDTSPATPTAPHRPKAEEHTTSPRLDSRSDDDDGTKVRKEAFGKHHMIFMWVGIALMWTIFELDNATVYNFQNYAVSEFEQVSLLGALSTAGTIVSAVRRIHE